MYNTIEDIVEAMKSKEVDGMLLDHYSASYYHKHKQTEITDHRQEVRISQGRWDTHFQG